MLEARPDWRGAFVQHATLCSNILNGAVLSMDADVAVLVEAIEDSFGVKFSKGELTDDCRFEDLCSLVRSRLRSRTSELCFTSVVFWRLRQACVNVFGMDRNSVTPSTSTELTVPVIHRRRAWQAWSDAAGLDLPRLEYHHHLDVPILLASFVPSIVLLLAGDGGWWIAAALIAMPITANLIFFLLRPFADALPAHCQTLGAVAKAAGGPNDGKLVLEFGPGRDRELVEALRYVVADVTDIDPHALIVENPRLIDLVLANDGLRTQA